VTGERVTLWAMVALVQFKREQDIEVGPEEGDVLGSGVPQVVLDDEVVDGVRGVEPAEELPEFGELPTRQTGFRQTRHAAIMVSRRARKRNLPETCPPPCLCPSNPVGAPGFEPGTSSPPD
jgi:hypothetical protein